MGVKLTDTATVACACGESVTFRFCYLDDWKCRCPACKEVLVHPAPPSTHEAVEQDRNKLREFIAGVRVKSQRFYGNRRFAGSERQSITKGFHPNEIGFIRKHITAGDIDPATGDVSFSDRAEERKFNQQFDAMAQKLGGMPGKNDVAEIIEG